MIEERHFEVTNTLQNYDIWQSQVYDRVMIFGGYKYMIE